MCKAAWRAARSSRCLGRFRRFRCCGRTSRARTWSWTAWAEVVTGSPFPASGLLLSCDRSPSEVSASSSVHMGFHCMWVRPRASTDTSEATSGPVVSAHLRSSVGRHVDVFERSVRFMRALTGRVCAWASTREQSWKTCSSTRGSSPQKLNVLRRVARAINIRVAEMAAHPASACLEHVPQSMQVVPDDLDNIVEDETNCFLRSTVLMGSNCLIITAGLGTVLNLPQPARGLANTGDVGCFFGPDAGLRREQERRAPHHRGLVVHPRAPRVDASGREPARRIISKLKQYDCEAGGIGRW